MKRKKQRNKETKLIHSLITSIYQVWDSGMYTHSCVRFDFHRDADRRFRNGWANSCSLESFQTVGNPIQRGTLFDSIFKYCNVLQLVKHLSLTRPLNQKKKCKIKSIPTTLNATEIFLYGETEITGETKKTASHGTPSGGELPSVRAI